MFKKIKVDTGKCTECCFCNAKNDCLEPGRECVDHDGTSYIYQFDNCFLLRERNQKIINKYKILEALRESINKHVERDFIDCFTVEFQEKAINGMFADLEKYFVK